MLAGMQWELHDGVAQVGPLEEDHVLRMIWAGLPAQTVVRQVGEAPWRSPRTHAPFAIALDQKAASMAPQQGYPQPYHPPQPYPLAPPPPQVVVVREGPPERSAGIMVVRVIGGALFVGGIVGTIPGCIAAGPVGLGIALFVVFLGWLLGKAEG